MSAAEVQACLTSMRRMRQRLIKLNEALKKDYSLAEHPDYRVGYPELRDLDLRTLEVLRRTLPADSEIIQEWDVHSPAAFSMNANDEIENYELKLSRLEFVLDMLQSPESAAASGSSQVSPAASTQVQYDAFISHASEDKDSIARPLAQGLREKRFEIWFDEFTLTIGDSLRRSIDHGLANSRYGIVILSPAFFAKDWPQYELDGLTTRQMSGRKVILPVWHSVGHEAVAQYSPSLADKVAIPTAGKPMSRVVDALAAVLKQ